MTGGFSELSYVNDRVDQRASTRDRRLLGEWRSIVLPDLFYVTG